MGTSATIVCMATQAVAIRAQSHGRCLSCFPTWEPKDVQALSAIAGAILLEPWLGMPKWQSFPLLQDPLLPGHSQLRSWQNCLSCA